MEFETERLILCPWNENDADELYELAKDPEIGPLCGWTPHQSKEESIEIIRNVLSDPMSWCVTDKEKGTVLGSVSLMNNPRWVYADGASQIELGFWIGRPFWGHGYIPEASLALIDYAFNDLHADRIWAGHLVENNNSRRVQDKLGFQYVLTVPTENRVIKTDTPKDHVRVLTKEKWNNR